jgi:predicted nucleotide-binding protein (sugar kinase/HSP70/actin superfamily)
MIIGIPRALIYWKRPYFWEDFFEDLGFQVLVSPETNKEIVELGVKVSDPENCFSNKVYWGHLVWLEGKCDLIFVPRLKATKERLEYCPKFFGLPDLAKILVKTPILTETFDPRKEKIERTFNKLGKKIKKNSWEIKKALENALLKEKELKEKENREFFEKIHSEKQKVILISHSYNLYDEYVNLRIKEKLEKLGVEPIFIDRVPIKIQNSKYKIQNLNRPRFHWEFAEEIMEKIETILNYKISGAIEISSFACGCDAVLKEFVAREFKERKIPFLYLIIDEQTGEAGFQTRLEAFIDTLNH